jgi:flagellar hook protein FlgE
MFGSVYTGLSGMMAFSKGLDVISNNVANLNTPGYKASDLLFRDLFYHFQSSGNGGEENSSSQIGTGVSAKDTVLRFQQGDIKETGNATDASIDGNGLFILRSSSDTFYTRDGQFEFDADGFLVARGTDARVAGLDASGGLVDINITGMRTHQAASTTKVTLLNNLSSGSTTHEISDIQVIDSLGGTHTFSMTLTNNNAVTQRSWLIDCVDESGLSVFESEEIRFDADGSPLEGFNSITASYEPTGAVATEITFDFGDPGSFSGVTSFSAGTSSTMRFDSQNGFAAGVLLSTEFDEDGNLSIEYSNGQSAKNGQLALAWFQDIQAMEQIGDGMFLAPSSANVTISAPKESVMGKIVGGNVEISNVDLTREFTDLIIVQRGFQASSQVLTVTNEMMQQLLDTGRSG